MTIVLSCVGVFISCKQVCEIRSLIFSCFYFQGLRKELSPALQQSSARPIPLPPLSPGNLSIRLVIKFWTEQKSALCSVASSCKRSALKLTKLICSNEVYFLWMPHLGLWSSESCVLFLGVLGADVQQAPRGLSVPVVVWEQSCHTCEAKAGASKAQISIKNLHFKLNSPVVSKMLHLCVKHSLIFLFCVNTEVIVDCFP